MCVALAAARQCNADQGGAEMASITHALPVRYVGAT